MDVISVKQASEKWGVHIRIVQKYCMSGRIAGVKKFGNNWLIPANAEKPTDPRRVKQEKMYLLDDLINNILPPTVSDSGGTLTSLKNEAQRMKYESELAYARGDFQQVKRCFIDAADNSLSKLCTGACAISAAISTGDYRFYTKIVIFLNKCIAENPNSDIAKLAELCLATAAVSMFVPDMVPKWLKEGDLSGFSTDLKPFVLYLYVKYLQNIRQYTAMLAVAKTSLTLYARESSFTLLDIYLQLMCACASYALSQKENVCRYLSNALAIGMPAGLITPFAENLVCFGGILETILARDYQNYYHNILSQWENTWKNWISFHNRFAKDNITTILTLREYQIAQLLTSGATYSEAAQHMNLSHGALNNAVSSIYEKLYIKKKSDLRPFIL